MITSADLMKAVETVWSEYTLDSTFKNWWTESQRSSYLTLHDQEALAGQPMPYCVVQEEASNTQGRMSSRNKTGRFETRDVIYQFNVHARQFAGIDKGAKDIARELAEEIIKFYGGHPTVQPKQLILDNGDVLLAQYQTDYPVRTGDEEYQWIIRYLFRLDVPVAA